MQIHRKTKYKYTKIQNTNTQKYKIQIHKNTKYNLIWNPVQGIEMQPDCITSQFSVSCRHFYSTAATDSKLYQREAARTDTEQCQNTQKKGIIFHQI